MTDPISGTILAAFALVALWPLVKKLLPRRTPIGEVTTYTDPSREDSLR